MTHLALLSDDHVISRIYPEQDAGLTKNDARVRGRLVNDRNHVATILNAQNLAGCHTLVDALKQECFVAPGDWKVGPEEMRKPMHFRHRTAAVPRPPSAGTMAEQSMESIAVCDLDDSIPPARFITHAVRRGVEESNAMLAPLVGVFVARLVNDGRLEGQEFELPVRAGHFPQQRESIHKWPYSNAGFE